MTIALKKLVSPPIVSTSNVVTPTVEKTNDGFQTVGKKKKRKGKSKSTNGAQFAGPSVKQNVRYEPKAATSVPKKGDTTYMGLYISIVIYVEDDCIMVPICNSIKVDRNNADGIPFTGGSAKDQLNVNSNFLTLVADPVFDGVNIFIPRKVVEKEQLGRSMAEKDYDEFQKLLFL
ncbi:hypothetical protein Tco_0565459 [Tanacetum coccineum]